ANDNLESKMRPLFVGNIEYDARQPELERLFSKYGRIERVDMKSGNPFEHLLRKKSLYHGSTLAKTSIARQPICLPINLLSFTYFIAHVAIFQEWLWWDLSVLHAMPTTINKQFNEFYHALPPYSESCCEIGEACLAMTTQA
ncbi:hypothetical protein H5410_011746, partial [Solanum commersonii]